MRSKDTNQACDSCRLQTARPSAAQKRKNIGRVRRYFCVSFGKTLSEPSSLSDIRASYDALTVPETGLFTALSVPWEAVGGCGFDCGPWRPVDRMARIGVPASARPTGLALGKTLHLSEPQFQHLGNGSNRHLRLTRCSRNVREGSHLKHWTQCLARSVSECSRTWILLFSTVRPPGGGVYGAPAPGSAKRRPPLP